MSAIDAWKQCVAAHQVQSAQTREAAGIPAADNWEPCSSSFIADPHRMNDPEVERLAREVTPLTTLLDVGGGAGRFALPLALRCRHVTVVEPSPGMGASLNRLARKTGIENVTLVASRWAEAEVEPADVVLCAHVIYMIADIRPFVRKLVRHARTKVCMPTFMRPPTSRFAPFWPWVHGETQHEVPGAAAFMQVLWEMDIYPQLEMFEPQPPRTFKSWPRALEMLRQRLFVTPDTEKDALLQQAMRALLIETPNGYALKDAAPGRLALISWRPE
jgi:ubiquinone/menaquinone biosynthesis C-methylase UbiE